ncbi:E3 ubiquitin-protein ligase RDUF1, partial [Cucurbita argyrosperma subsp. argyrosperma]
IFVRCESLCLSILLHHLKGEFFSAILASFLPFEGDHFWILEVSWRSLISEHRIRIDAIDLSELGLGPYIRSLPSVSPVDHRFPPAAMNHDDASDLDPSFVPRLRRSRRNGEDRSSFNRIIVLRDPSNSGAISNNGVGGGGNYEIYYDDGTGASLRSLPSNISEFLMGSGIDRLLNQLAQLEVNGVGPLEHPPASKAAIESLPVVKILASDVPLESHCAVCKEPFELDSEARQMPCKHIYHSDCIFPWLSIRNSCPVCRHQLPTDAHGSGRSSPASAEEVVGLTIWRLPGGGFAVGRFTWGRGAAEHDLPVVYTEIDGGFSTTSGVPRSITWASSGIRSNESGGFRRIFRNFFSFFGRFRSTSRRSGSVTGLIRRSFSTTLFNRRSRRNNHSMVSDANYTFSA